MSETATESNNETVEDVGIDYVGEPKTVDMGFVYPTHLDPARQAKTDHGVYLDDIQRREAEIHRAKVEDRKPDLKNPPSTVSTPLIPVHVAQATRTADSVIEVDVILPVELGVPADQLDSNQAAKDYQLGEKQDEYDEDNDNFVPAKDLDNPDFVPHRS